MEVENQEKKYLYIEVSLNLEKDFVKFSNVLN